MVLREAFRNQKLKQERLVLDWRKRQKTQAAVKIFIEEGLDTLPEAFTDDQYRHKCDTVYQHVYECDFGAGKSIYAAASFSPVYC